MSPLLRNVFTKFSQTSMPHFGPNTVSRFAPNYYKRDNNQQYIVQVPPTIPTVSVPQYPRFQVQTVSGLGALNPLGTISNITVSAGTNLKWRVRTSLPSPTEVTSKFTLVEVDNNNFAIVFPCIATGKSFVQYQVILNYQFAVNGVLNAPVFTNINDSTLGAVTTAPGPTTTQTSNRRVVSFLQVTTTTTTTNAAINIQRPQSVAGSTVQENQLIIQIAIVWAQNFDPRADNGITYPPASSVITDVA